jgi:hypothetical protein
MTCIKIITPVGMKSYKDIGGHSISKAGTLCFNYTNPEGYSEYIVIGRDNWKSFSITKE